MEIGTNGHEDRTVYPESNLSVVQPLAASHGANGILAWRAAKAAPTKHRIDQIRCILRVVQALILSLLVISPVSADPGSHKAKQMPAKTINNQASQVFLGNLRARILHNWLAPDGKNTVIIEATVSPEGEVLSSTTAASQADSLAIAAATTAFEKAQPLGHLPTGYNSNSKITLTLTSSVDPHGDSTSNLTSRIDQVIIQRSQDSARPTK
jgi:hypothetical protein